MITKYISKIAAYLSMGMMLVLVSNGANAHHSAAMIDTSKCKIIKGKVRVLQFKYPHSWLWVNVKSESGEIEPWGFESISPSQLSEVDARWSRKILKKGDEVIVEFSPLKDGRNGGQLQSVELPNGDILNGWAPAHCPRAKANVDKINESKK